MDAMAVRSFGFTGYPGNPILIRYPLATGLYVIANGGNGLDGIGMNDSYRDWLGRPTASSDWLAYSVDIVEMGTRGNMADSLFSTKFDRYVGYQDRVFAPCPGKVVLIEDGHEDVPPFSAPSDPLGNRVVINCFNFYVTVANLRNGNIPVEVGDEVSLRQVVGYVGNSGTPSIPHLHIHVTTGYWDESGIPTPILFEWDFQARNGVYIK
jgi:hypothetical protein